MTRRATVRRGRARRADGSPPADPLVSLEDPLVRVAGAGSVRDRAFAAAAAGAPHGTLVLARSAGDPTGWLPGDLRVATVLRPALAPPAVGRLRPAGALAAAAAVAATGVRPDARVAWPGDVVLAGDAWGDGAFYAASPVEEAVVGTARVAVPAEPEWRRSSGGAAPWCAVVGVGIGLRDAAASTAAAHAGRDEPPAAGSTSVAAAGGDPAPGRLVVRLHDHLLARCHVAETDPAALRAAWRRRTVTLGRRVRTARSWGRVVGRAVDLTLDGRLVVLRPDGGRTAVDPGVERGAPE